MRPGALSDEWLVLGGVVYPRLYEIATGQIHGASRDKPPLQSTMSGASIILDGSAYNWEPQSDGRTIIRRAELPDGAIESFDAPEGGRVVGLVEGYVVLGAYSEPGLAGSRGGSWPASMPLIMGSLVVVGIVGVPSWWLARRFTRRR